VVGEKNDFFAISGLINFADQFLLEAQAVSTQLRGGL
jgi:hypothetical protein